MRFEKLNLCIILLALAIMSAQSAFGADVREDQTIMGVKGGLISPGTVYVEGIDYDSDISYTLGGFIDYRLAEKIFGGATLDLMNMSAYDDNSMMIHLGVTLKALIYSEYSKLTFRPGIGIGYGRLGSLGPADGSDYFILMGGVEMIMATKSDLSWLAEIDIIGGPAGGNDEYEITFGPGFILRGGIIF